jgi:hypothetical protein
MIMVGGLAPGADVTRGARRTLGFCGTGQN